MAHSASTVMNTSLVPHDGFDDSEFAEHSERYGQTDGAQQMPSAVVKRFSGTAGDTLSRKHSVVDNVSHALSVLTRDRNVDTHAVDYIDTKAVSLDKRSSMPEDGFDDSEFVQYLEGGPLKRKQPVCHGLPAIARKALSTCQGVVDMSSQVFTNFTQDLKEDTCAVDYIETACSLLHRIRTDDNEIRNIVTGGTADAWYPAPAPPPRVGPLMCFVPLAPVSLQVTVGMPTHQVIIPTLACNAAAAQPSIEDAEQNEPLAACSLSSTLVSENTPLRPPGLFLPVAISEKEDALAEEPTKTTIMLRNIPFTITRSKIMDVLRSKGLADHVVFIYVPMSFRTWDNFGYAFVDFDSMKVAEHCKDILEGFNGWSYSGDTVVKVEWSVSQGIDSHIERCRDSPIMHPMVEDEFKPAMFKNGVRIAFPCPSTPIRAPRLRKSVDRRSQ